MNTYKNNIQKTNGKNIHNLYKSYLQTGVAAQADHFVDNTRKYKYTYIMNSYIKTNWINTHNVYKWMYTTRKIYIYIMNT